MSSVSYGGGPVSVLTGTMLGAETIPRLPARMRPQSRYKVCNRKTPAEIEFHRRGIRESIILQEEAEGSRYKNLRNKIIFKLDCRQDFLDFQESGPVPKEKLMEIDNENLTLLLERADAHPVYKEIASFPGVKTIGLENPPPFPVELYGDSTPLVDVTVKHSPEEHRGWYQLNFEAKHRDAWLEFRKGYVIETRWFQVPQNFGDEPTRIWASVRGTSEERAAQLHKMRCFPGIKSIETYAMPSFGNRDLLAFRY
eukprot:596234_1